MTENPISQALQQFIANHIQSVEQLEILCLLAKNPSKLWSVDEVFRHVQSTEKSVMKCLLYFTTHQLATRNAEGLFRFASETSELANTVGKLANVYRQRRVTVIEMIYKKPSSSFQHRLAIPDQNPKERE